MPECGAHPRPLPRDEPRPRRRGLHPALFGMLLVAGGVHATKATVRPVVTATSGGVLNPAVSAIEDVMALIITVVSILVPLLVGFLMGAICVAMVWWLRTRRRREERVR